MPDNMKRPRVALLTPIPTPYRLPFYGALAERCDLTVYFDALSEPNRRWTWKDSDFKFRYDVLKGAMISYRRHRNHSNPKDHRYLQLRYDILPRLFRLKPDVVVSGEMGSRSLQADLYCRLTSTPLILWWEGTPHTEGVTGGLKPWVRRYLVKRAARFWSNGVESNQLLKEYGADEGDIDPGMTGIDSFSLRSRVGEILPERDRVRREIGVRGNVFMFLGELGERKGVMEFLSALDGIYRKGLRNWSVMFVGAGPLEGAVRRWSSTRPEITCVVTGFLQPPELPRYFAAADSFVLPTLDDNWSLVAIEALAAGLPQMFSIYNGCTGDLNVDPAVGEKFDPLDLPGFTQSLEKWAVAPPSRIDPELAGRFVEYYSSEKQAYRAFSSISAALETVSRK